MLKTSERQELIQKRGNKCECCGLTEWLGQPIHLEVHHIDGNRQNDNLNNLQILCHNCHSYTNNHSKNIYRHFITDEELVTYLQNAKTIHQALLNANLSTAGANYTRAKKLIQQYDLTHLYKLLPDENMSYCIDCGAPITSGATRCPRCKAKAQRVVERPTRVELKDLIRHQTFVSIGKQFGVSGNAIVKWCRTYELPSTKREINQYSDEEWNSI